MSDEAALAAIAALIEQVNALEAAQSLNAGQANALRNHLVNAQREILAGRYCAARAQLGGFRQQVENFERDGVLSGADADTLTDPVGDVLGDTPFVAASISTSGNHSCGISSSGRAYCWGANHSGQLGNGSVTAIPVVNPVPVATTLRFSSIVVGSLHTCARTASGAVHCWGSNANGRLGDGTLVDRSTPTPVAGVLQFSSISAMQSHTCGVTPSGAAYCWGDNEFSQLGDGTAAEKSVPTMVAGGHTFSAVSAGFLHTCALTTVGAAYCWGDNRSGQLGDGTTVTRAMPTAVVGDATYASVNAGGFFSCALDPGGSAHCWGSNGEGYLGDGTTTDHFTPAPVAGGVFESLSAGHFHTCTLTASGAAQCWGSNTLGSPGIGSFGGVSTTPVAVSGGLAFEVIHAGGNATTCAVTTSRAAYCWGNNHNGQLGDGMILSNASPVAVVGWTSLQ